MTKQEKFLLLIVLVVSGVGATLYVQNTKDANTIKEQVQISTDNISKEQVQTDTGNTGVIRTITDQSQVVQPEGSLPRQPSNGPQTNTSLNTNTNTNSGTVRAAIKSTKQATVSYSVPSGVIEDLSVTVVLEGEVISDIRLSMLPTNGRSTEYYNSFKNSFPKSQVVGKTLSSVSLSRVGGASLTTNAFNKAIGELRG